MYDSIRETRARKNGFYSIVLEIPEDIYLNFYEEFSDSAAKEMLCNYLNYRQDDAVPENVSLEHIADDRIIRVYADLHYLGNKKAE
ncbi:MAG: hypothetical protein ACOX15_02015 [Tepidanaerobacteraceae bacterium]